MKEKPVIYLFDMLQQLLIGVHILSSSVYHSNNCWEKLGCQRPVAAARYRCVGPGRLERVLAVAAPEPGCCSRYVLLGCETVRGAQVGAGQQLLGSVALRLVSWNTDVGGWERTEVVIKSVGCVSRVTDNGSRSSKFNLSESKIQPLGKTNVVCRRGSPLSFCQPPQAMLNPFLFVSDFAALPAVDIIWITPGSLHLRIPQGEQPPCSFFTCPHLTLRRVLLFTVDELWNKHSRCLGLGFFFFSWEKP